VRSRLYGVGLTALLIAIVSAAPAPVDAQAVPSPAPTATPDPLTFDGFVRSYYFTRQNASNNPGVQFDYTPKAPYISNAVNLATWSTGVSLSATYRFPDGGWFARASYFYSNPLNGPCSVAANNLKGAKYPSPSCTSQVPPNTNPDDAMPGFALSTLYEAFVGYDARGWSGKIGDQLFTSPWANPADTRLKPAAFQGADVSYSAPAGWQVEGADMIEFEGRANAAFTDTTLLTSYPAGGSGGLPSNIYVPNCYASGCDGIHTNGFSYGRIGYESSSSPLSGNAYFYGVQNIVDMWWFDAAYRIAPVSWQPTIALQGGFDRNAGLSYVGNVDSDVFGFKLRAVPAKNVAVSFGFDDIPWKTSSLVLPSYVSCSSTGATPSYQIKVAPGKTFPYFLPSQVAQCSTSAAGVTTLYLGGWASPYTDAYTSDPLFTTSEYQGMIQHRSPGTSEKIQATFTSRNNRVVFIASDAWYDYGNALAPQNTNEWDLDGRYRFSPYSGQGPYRGLVLRDRYQQRTATNTYYPIPVVPGLPYLGGIPLLKYNRVQAEYDF